METATLWNSNMSSTLNSTSIPQTTYGQEFVAGLRTCFYLVTPAETTFEHFEDVPNYFTKYTPFLPIIMIPEILGVYLQGKKLPGFGETVCSLLCIILIFIPAMILGQIEIGTYIWLYDNYRIVDLPWDAVSTWIFCLFAVDFGFYWWHRAAHEVNIIWAFHQVHHTSQEFNVAVGFRVPSLNRYIAVIFVLPLAFVFPPSIFYAHYQINYLYQLWIHSNACPSFGWLDYIINSPSTHRVHHGRNRYCIDKNYGGFLNIWDVLFGTFELERPNEKISNGLVTQINSFDCLYLQGHHLRAMYRKIKEMDGIRNKLSVIFKGPGWYPGTRSRLGNIEDIPEIPDYDIYDKPLPLWLRLYLTVHLLLTFLLFQKMKSTKMLLPLSMSFLHGGYVLWSVACITYFTEAKSYAPLLDGTRCAVYFLLEIALHQVLASDDYLMYFMRAVFFLSTLICIFNLRLFTNNAKEKKID